MLTLTKNLFGVATSAALVLAVMVCLTFGAAVIVGGTTGSVLATTAGRAMEYGIYIAAAAMLIGVIDMYVRGAHSLKVDSATPEDDIDDDEEGNEHRS